jgi:hypothetical protein
VKLVRVTNPVGSKKVPGDQVLIEKISAAPGVFTQTNGCPIRPATLAAGHSCTITVTFKPTAATVDSGALKITDNAKGSPQTVTLSGKGK